MNQKYLGLAEASRKISKNKRIIYSYIKKPITRPSKIIRIQIFDAENFEQKDSSMCNHYCEAEVCAQHVVKNIILDDIFSSTKELINKIQENMENS